MPHPLRSCHLFGAGIRNNVGKQINKQKQQQIKKQTHSSLGFRALWYPGDDSILPSNRKRPQRIHNQMGMGCAQTNLPRAAGSSPGPAAPALQRAESMALNCTEVCAAQAVSSLIPCPRPPALDSLWQARQGHRQVLVPKQSRPLHPVPKRECQTQSTGGNPDYLTFYGSSQLTAAQFLGNYPVSHQLTKILAISSLWSK